MESRLAAVPAGKEYGYAYRAPAVRLADPRRVFAERATRFARLAEGYPLGGFLSFMAALSRAQQTAADALPPVTLPPVILPPGEQLRQCYQHGMPPLGFETWEQAGEAAWRDALKRIVSEFETADLPEQTQAALRRIQQADTATLDGLVDTFLRFPGEDRALAPFIAAALQVYWVNLASALDAQALAPQEDTGVCPACGSPPVAGIVRMGGDVHALRYLSCPLCATEWHMARIKCSHCLSTQGIAYHSVEGQHGKSWGAVKAETCEACRTYLKLMYMEKDIGVEAIADDLATLTLDILLAEAGWQRVAPNPFLLADGA